MTTSGLIGVFGAVVASCLAVAVFHGIGANGLGGIGSEQCELSPRGLLAALPEDHNRSLLWGTYRPGVYFGVRSRTGPVAVVAGMMWGFRDARGELVLRHQCQESDDLQKYGWSRHDGETFGIQVRL